MKPGAVQYWYFFCTGRQRHCDQPYVPVIELEAEVMRYYQTIQLTANEAAQLGERVRAAIVAEVGNQQTEATRQRARISRLQSQRDKLLTAFYAGAIPLEQLKREQDRLTAELADASRRLDAAETSWSAVEAAVRQVIDLLSNCLMAYQAAPDGIRRLFNQAFFRKLTVDMRHVTGSELSEMVDTALGLRLGQDWSNRSDYQRQAPEPVFCGAGPNKDTLAGKTLRYSNYQTTRSRLYELRAAMS